MSEPSTSRGGPRPALRFLVWFVAAFCVFGGAALAHESGQAFARLLDLAPSAEALARRLPSFYDPRAVLFTFVAVALSALAAVLLRLLSRGAPRAGEETSGVEETGAARPRVPLTALERVFVALFALAAAAFLLVLKTHRDSPAVVGLWLAVQALALGAAFLIDARRGRGGPRVSRGEIVFLGLLCAAAAFGYSRDLDSFRFASLGDEWAVYDAAATGASDALPDPGSVFLGVEKGVYGVHAPFLSFVQSCVMRVAGLDNFGWRVSGVFALALALPCFYAFARLFLGRFAAGFATVLTALSSYLLSEAHTGYGWGLTRLFTWAALAAFALLIRKPGLTAAVAVGIFCGHASLVGATASPTPFLLLTALPFALSGRSAVSGRVRLLARPSRPLALTLWGAALAMFLLTSVVPGAAFRSPGVPLAGIRPVLWKTNVGPLLTHYLGPNWTNPPLERSYTPGEFLSSTRDNLLRAVLAPLSYRGSSHFVHGPVLDAVTAGLAILGFLVSVSSRRLRRRTRLLWFVFGAFLLTTGGLSPAFEYSDLRITRMHFLVPFWTLFAGIGFVALGEGLAAATGLARARPALAAGLLAAAAALNFRTFYVHEAALESEQPAAWVVKEMAEAPADVELYMCLFEGWPPAGVEHYPGRERLHRVTAEDFVLSGGRPGPAGKGRLLFPDFAETPGCRKVLDWFLSAHPGVALSTTRDSTGRTMLLTCAIPDAPRPGAGDRRENTYFLSPCRAEESSAVQPVRVQGQIAKGSYSPPLSVAVLVLMPPGARAFSARLALADAADLPADTRVEFSVEVDGRLAGRPVLVRPGDPLVSISIPLADARVVALKTRLMAGSQPDRTLPVWLSPLFETPR